MRTYLTIDNLKLAAALGLVVGLMTVPRIIEAERSLDRGHAHATALLVAVFPLMTLVGGAATAWGKCAGMCGAFPDKRRTVGGLSAAVVLGLLLVAPALWVDMRLIPVVGRSAAAKALEYPATVAGCLALILWSAGFETLFFRAGAISFFCRLYGRAWIGIMAAVVLRIAVGLLRLGHTNADAYGLAAMAIASAIDGILFARAGLVPAMAFIGVLESRHLLRLAMGW